VVIHKGRIFIRVSIVTVLCLFFSAAIVAQPAQKSFWEHTKEGLSDPLIYSPLVAALALSFTDFDGEFSDYASEETPLFGSIKGAKDYSDNVTFKLLPLYAGLSQYFSLKSKGGGTFYQYVSFITPALATYLFNDFLKDRTGRLRPDSSNFESFPSSHTAIASSLTGVINFNFQDNEKYSLGVSLFNEIIVASVALARLEAKKHHLTDTLVGYSIGKFFAHMLHGYWQPQLKGEETLRGGAFINHKEVGLSLSYNF
jgi:membrane-associated phospholipid phosphatase